MATRTRTALKRNKKGPKSKRLRFHSSPGKTTKNCVYPDHQGELFRLHDIADSLKLLRDIAQEAPEMQLIQVEILIAKASHCAWNLIHEELDSRWQELNPHVDLIPSR